MTGPKKTLCELEREVTVVPTRTVPGGFELVRERVPRRYCTLSDARNPIILCAIERSNTMPVDRGT